MEGRGQNVFVISLDAIDFNLLPSLYNTTDDRILPLWTTSNLDRRNNEYYQFEIKTVSPEKSVQDKSPKCEFENILCDICNIEVPKSFLCKHRKSSRHITNLKIANTAVLRMKKYINNTNNENCCTDCKEIDPTAHFCAVCVTVVDSKEKATHEKSLAHKNSVILEKIFYDFLLLYSCQDEIVNGIPNNGTKCTNTNKHTNYINENNLDMSISDGVIKFVNETNTSNMVLKPPIKKQDDASDKLIEMKNINETTKAGILHEKAKNISLSDYLSLLNDSVDCSMAFELQNENNHNIIKIITIDGSVVKVKEENFHGFNRLGKNCIQCYPCGEVFKEKLIEKHKMSEKHIQYMITPLEDKHCARLIGDFLSHCLICNTIIEFSDFHPQYDIDHKVKLNKALINETKADSDNFAEQSQCLRKESNINTVSKDMETNEKDDTWIEVTKKLRKVDIQNSDARNETQESSGIENKFFCSSCNEFISIFCRSKHNSTAKHISNSKSKYHYLMREEDDKLFCKVCDVEIKNSNGYVKKHVFGKEHINKYIQKLSDNKIIKCTDFPDLFSCEICNELILVKNELLHMNEKSHKAKWFATGHNSEKTNPSDDDDDDNNISDIPKAVSQARYQMEKTKLPNLLKCKVCKVVVIYNEMQDHLFSIKHKINYYKLLKDNHILLKKNDCYCKACDIPVGKKSELVHVSGKNHNRMLHNYLGLSNANGGSKSSVIDSTGSVSTDKQNVSNNTNKPPSMSIVKDINNMGEPSVSNEKDMGKPSFAHESPEIESEMLALLLPTRNPKQVMCKICQVTVPYNVHNVTTHIKGAKHKLTQKKLLEDQAAKS